MEKAVVELIKDIIGNGKPCSKQDWKTISKALAEALKPSHNSDYAAALKAYKEYESSGVSTIDHFVTFPSWCEERLNATK